MGSRLLKKVFLIQEADKMSTGANSLLKFLEEPEGQILAILETTSFSNFTNDSITMPNLTFSTISQKH